MTCVRKNTSVNISKVIQFVFVILYSVTTFLKLDVCNAGFSNILNLAF